MSNIEITGMRVTCDSCNWECPVSGMEEAKNWLNIDCPKCGEPSIITEGDILEMDLLVRGAEVVNKLVINDDSPKVEVQYKSSSSKRHD